MKEISISLLCILIFFFISCEKNNDTDTTQDTELKLKSAQVVESNNNFAFDFFKEIDEGETEKENYMVSPVSLSLALGMAYNGAEGETETAFKNVLNYDGLTSEEINEVNESLIANLITSQEGSLFEVANSIWCRDGFPVKEEFITLNQNYYSAEVQSLDFNDPSAVDIINQWVSDKTHEKIPQIITSIPPEAMLYLINALYFNSTWKYEFDPEDNTEVTFVAETTGESKTLEMMSMEAGLAYYNNVDFSSVILPYKNDKYRMVLFRPEYGKTTNDVINSMSGEKWKEWKQLYETKEKVVVTMPKFKFEYKNILNDELKDLGLGIAFTEAADFTGISDIALLISMVLQKTYIDVNEEGTEAAAVTIIGFETTSNNDPGPARIIFTLDKSFVFMITEKETDAICFIGKVGDPEAE